MTQPLKRLVSSTVEQSTYVGVSVTLSNMIHMPGKLANTMCFFPSVHLEAAKHPSSYSGSSACWFRCHLFCSSREEICT